MVTFNLVIKIAAVLCFAFEAWRSKSLTALGLALLSFSLLF